MIRSGSAVKIHYTLTVDGSTVDSSQGRPPLAYEQGKGMIIPGLERELEGLGTGDKRKVTVAAKDGYGDYDPQAVQKVPKSVIGESETLKVGDQVEGRQGTSVFRARVAEVETESITLDLNHPLAGKTLEFDVEVVEVQDPG